MFANFSYNVSPNADDPGVDPGGGSSNMPIGVVVPFGGFTAPANWLLCNGTEVRTDLYPDLLPVIAYYYGSNSSTTQQVTSDYSINSTTEIGFAVGAVSNAFVKVGSYVKLSGYTATTGPNINGVILLITAAPNIGQVNSNYVGTPTMPLPATGNGSAGILNRFSIPLPDLRLATPVGVGSGITLGTSGGSATTTITADNLPQHNHGIDNGLGYDGANGLGNGSSSNFIRTNFVISRTLASQTYLNDNSTLATNSAISTRNPYVGMNYIIHAKN